MQGNSKVHFIPPIPKREQRVGIYCRVSTNSMDQLQSLTAQVSHLTRLTAAMSQWVLADVYMDIAISKTGSSRKEFNRLLEDCNSRKIEVRKRYCGNFGHLESIKDIRRACNI